jgi:hypothetical protein
LKTTVWSQVRKRFIMAGHYFKSFFKTKTESIAYLSLSWLCVLVLLAETAPRSLARNLSLPSFVTLAFMGTLSNTRTGSNHGSSDGVASLSFLLMLHFINLLYITRVDCRTKPVGLQPVTHGSMLNMGRLYRYRQAAFYMSCLRGIQTEHQIVRLPPPPAFYSSRYLAKSVKWYFIGYQVSVALWQLLFFSLMSDIMCSIPQFERDRYVGRGTEFHVFSLDGTKWLGRLMVTLLPTFLCGQFVIDITYRFLSVLSVLLGLTSLDAWPPLFGSPYDAYTVRGFWG